LAARNPSKPPSPGFLLRGVTDGEGPLASEGFVETFRDAVRAAASPRTLHQPFLRFLGSVPMDKNPRDSKVVTVADPCTSQRGRLPAVCQLLIG
jgi:hypothetical protein